MIDRKTIWENFLYLSKLRGQQHSCSPLKNSHTSSPGSPIRNYQCAGCAKAFPSRCNNSILSCADGQTQGLPLSNHRADTPSAISACTALQRPYSTPSTHPRFNGRAYLCALGGPIRIAMEGPRQAANTSNLYTLGEHSRSCLAVSVYQSCMYNISRTLFRVE